MAQPTCVEIQNVMAGVSGMNTASMRPLIVEFERELARAVN
jgi:hypothetical protein